MTGVSMGQTYRGAIAGSVAESSGAAVADASVRIINKGTGLTRTQSTPTARETIQDQDRQAEPRWQALLALLAVAGISFAWPIISEVFHKTLIALNEKRTETAAATSVAMVLAAGPPTEPPKPIEIKKWIGRSFTRSNMSQAARVCLSVA